MKSITIAQVAHAINRTYRQCLVEEDNGAWEDLLPEQKESIIQGVERYLDNPDLTPEESHNHWCQFKADNGWDVGDYDVDLKTHPNLVEYIDLPTEQRTKDYLFKATVLAMQAISPQEVSPISTSVVEQKGLYHPKDADYFLEAKVLRIGQGGNVELSVYEESTDTWFEATSIQVVPEASETRKNQRYFIPTK